MIVMQQIDQVSQDAAKLSICGTVYTGRCVCLCAFYFVCVCLCAFYFVFVRFAHGQGQG